MRHKESIMNLRLSHALSLLAFSSLAFESAVAADEIAPLPGLDACLATALQQRPGVLFGWKSLNEPPDGSYRISIIGTDNRVAETVCSPASTTLRFDNRAVTRRYEYYKQMAVPEGDARKTAPLIFAGTVRIVSMEIDTDLKGGLRYEYRMLLPSGHHALAQVDAMSGFLTYIEARE
jgi:hypothetical protein